MPEILVGLVLAGLFAATMSTADSQILSCSAALTQDLAPRKWSASYLFAKLGTLTIALFALFLAIKGPQSVFQVVLLAWSALAASLGPLLILRSLGRPIPTGLGLAMMVGGLLAILLWRDVLHYSADMYEILPGILSGFLIYGLGRFTINCKNKLKA